jgi:hypothetical protein
LDFKWQGVFLKIRGGAKTRKQTRKRNQTQLWCSNTLPENLFSKENYMEKESKENLRKRIL